MPKPAGEAEKSQPIPDLLETVIEIEGMSCAACSSNVETQLGKVPGVVEARVNLATKKAYVRHGSSVTRDDLKKTVEDTGYGVKSDLATVMLHISDMSCASCAMNVRQSLERVDGVKRADVNFARATASVDYDPASTSIDKLREAIEAVGYSVVSDGDRAQVEIDHDLVEVHRAKRRMLLAWAFTLPIILWMIPEMLFHWAPFGHGTMNVGMVLLSLPVLLIPGAPTYRSAFKSVTHGLANMDLLISMGTIAAYATGPASFAFPVANFSGIAAMIMAFHLTGRYLEARAKGRASEAIKKLLKLEADTAVIIVDGDEVEVPIQRVKVGDIMIVRPGEKIPTDGVVVDGMTTIDESMATGESLPVSKAIDDEVIGSTINQQGVIKVRATKVGRDTFLAQVIRLVEEAQGTRVPIQQFADRVTSVFVPVVIGLATFTLIIWLLFPSQLRQVLQLASPYIPWVKPGLDAVSLAVGATVAVLVIACPCALGLATPTALMVGSGLGAENGVLIRNAAAIQLLQESKTIIFDKTGTITKGTPSVTHVYAVPGGTEHEVLKMAAAVEQGSEHPLGRAIVAKARELEHLEIPPMEAFVALPGKGIRAQTLGRQVVLGTRLLLRESGIDPSPLEDEVRALEEKGNTVVLVALDQRPVGAIALADTTKPDSRDAIQELHRLGYRTVMLTGDNKRTAEAISREVGISQAIAEVLPADKAAVVRQMQEAGERVVMVGDGINDAPALTQADVGVAIGTGTDIAIEASDITLVRGDLTAVVTAINISRHTFKKIKENLFWAFAYNVVAIPVAILGLLHPVIAEIAMAASSISVVTNANRLRYVRVRPSYPLRKS